MSEHGFLCLVFSWSRLHVILKSMDRITSTPWGKPESVAPEEGDLDAVGGGHTW